MKSRAYRLPKTLWPLHYRIELWVDADKNTFPGIVTLTLDVRQANATLELYADHIRIDRALWILDTHEFEAPSIEYDQDKQLVRILPPREGLPLGTAKLRLHYQGRINPGLNGLYLGRDGKDRVLCTQCQATAARQIFPCFDEPAFKAPLEWVLHTPPGLVALTNGPLREKQTSSQEEVWHYEATRRISSYLAALVVGELEGAAPSTVRGIPLATYATKGRKEQTVFAQTLIAKLLPFYEDYFGVPYPYKKYDQVAVPGFDAGAMENIGLVLFRQTALLLDPQTASWRQEKRVVSVVAHEMAHMWFGNWVTLQWWDDLWLNEAFAEWICHKAIDTLFPDYKIWEEFQEGRFHAMGDDALPTTRPIWSPVETPEQATEMFDTITYEKGCAVMRMLENFLGEHAFREGLREYMKKFAENNATGQDLWAALSESSGQAVGPLMQAWVAQAGFPVLIVTPNQKAGDWSQGALLLSQRRFFASATDALSTNSQTWHIPVVIRYADDQGEHIYKHLLTETQQSIHLPIRGKLQWCYANADEVGFYRVQYEAQAWESLLESGIAQLSPVEQAGLLSDQWALVYNGQRPLEPLLDLLTHLAAHPQRQVLRVVQEQLHALERFVQDLANPSTEAQFRRWVQQIVPSLAQSMANAEHATPAEAELGATALSLRARLGEDSNAVAYAENQERKERKDSTAIDSNFAGVVVGITAHFGGETTYQAFLDTYVARQKAGLSPQETLRYLYALPLFRKPELVQRTLELIDNEIVPQDSIRFLLGSLLAQKHSQQAAWQYLCKQWSHLQERVGEMGLSRLVEMVGSLPFSIRKEVISFFEKNPPLRAERALARALKHMEQHHDAFVRISASLQTYFTGKFSSKGP